MKNRFVVVRDWGLQTSGSWVWLLLTDNLKHPWDKIAFFILTEVVRTWTSTYDEIVEDFMNIGTNGLFK